MPHIIVKLAAGKTETQKQDLAEAITRSVAAILDYGEDAVSVAMEEVAPDAWAEQVYRPDIIGKPGTLYKTPGYTM
jgi:4-oxalocrotonate tautomerase